MGRVEQIPADQMTAQPAPLSHSTVLSAADLSGAQIDLIKQTVEMFTSLSRRELVRTVCELLSWHTPTGALRIHWCEGVLEALEGAGALRLPDKDLRKQRVAQRPIKWTARTLQPAPIEAPLAALMPVRVALVSGAAEVCEWNEWVDRYHYLGYRRPLGPHLRYFILDGASRKLGALLFSYGMRQVSCRERWIGWSAEGYREHLDKVLCNSRFLIFPWVRVKCLASKSLALAVRRLPDDWWQRYGYRPLLLETYIDKSHYDGICFRAANWQYIGDTRGRTLGRSTPGRGVKAVYVYPLVKQAKAKLCGAADIQVLGK